MRGKHTLLLSPIGGQERESLRRIAKEVSRVFGHPARICPLLDDISFAFDPEREQYHSTPILDALARLAPPGTLKVLGIVSVDLFIPILTYVYGEAQLGGTACVVSSRRLREGALLPALYRTRLVKEAVHELGHTFNLRHCRDPECLMHYCRGLGDVDRKSTALCRYCRVLLDDEIERIGAGPPECPGSFPGAGS